MKIKRLDELVKGDIVLNETPVGLEFNTVDEIDVEDGSFLAYNMLNVYPDENTNMYVVLERYY